MNGKNGIKAYNTELKRIQNGTPAENRETSQPPKRVLPPMSGVVPKRKMADAAAPGDPLRAAKLLLLLPPDESQLILKGLKETELRKITRQICETGAVSFPEAEEILKRAGKERVSPRAVQGGESSAFALLKMAFGDKRAGEIIKKGMGTFDFLLDLPPQKLFDLLRKENTQVLAAVLPALGADKSSYILQHLPEDVKKNVVVRMMKGQTLGKEIVSDMASKLKKKLELLTDAPGEEIDGAKVLAGILRYMSPEDERRILDDLKKDIPDIEKRVEDEIYTIDILHQVPMRHLEELVADMSDQDIAMILKGLDEELTEMMENAVTERRRMIIGETRVLLGPVPRREVEKKIKDFLKVLRERVRSGEIILNEEAEEYI